LYDISDAIDANGLFEHIYIILRDYMNEDQDIYIDLHSKAASIEKWEGENRQTFQERINTLRKELIQSIRKTLIDRNLTEIEILDEADKEPEDAVFVVRFDDDSNGYNSLVLKVSLHEDGICLDVKDEYSGWIYTLYPYDFGCQNPDWLSAILNKIQKILHIQENTDK
jgi:hypothetical protein